MTQTAKHSQITKSSLNLPPCARYPSLHICCYVLSWLAGLANPLVYVLCSSHYRHAASAKLGTIANILRTKL